MAYGKATKQGYIYQFTDKIKFSRLHPVRKTTLHRLDMEKTRIDRYQT